jgi:hypothetical protein
VETPAGSLQRLGAGFAARDRAAVARYLDVPRTVESAVDQIVAGATKVFVDSVAAATQRPGATKVSGHDAIATAFAVGILQVMKPALRTYFEAAISRALAADSAPPAAVVGPFGRLLGDRPLDTHRFKRQYRGIKRVQMQGTVALVDVEFHNDSTGITFVPQLRMERRERYWQLVGFTNLSDVVQGIAADKRKTAP